MSRGADPEMADSTPGAAAAIREAVVALDDGELEGFGFGGLVALIREAGLREVELLEDDGYTCLPQVTVERRLDHDRLESFDCVDDWALVTERDDAVTYLLELTATDLPEDIVDTHDALVGPCDTTVTERGVRLSLVGPQDAIGALLRDFEDAGALPELHSLGAYEGTTATLDALTDRQREVLETAYELGFYEVPREASTEAVARELGLDPATVAEHLQRAEHNLLTRHLTD